MPRELSAYHRRVAADNRTAILEAATDLFLGLGYDRTSLARVADHAGVSKATLFKQFPTKAELFEATVLAAGDTSDAEPLEPPSGDFHAGLVSLGMAYAELLSRPRMADLIRAVISESARFPELRQRTFDFGTLPVLRALRRYFQAANAQGAAHVNDYDVAAAQFLGMIAAVVFWPRLVHGSWSPTDEETLRTVDEAAQTIVARYATRPIDADVRTSDTNTSVTITPGQGR
jgi:TetR/AcrR family transcriptional regulator, regulator of autoinduction and epiphytic fitness